VLAEVSQARSDTVAEQFRHAVADSAVVARDQQHALAAQPTDLVRHPAECPVGEYDPLAEPVSREVCRDECWRAGHGRLQVCCSAPARRM
jgi:hypothetical protein